MSRQFIILQDSDGPQVHNIFGAPGAYHEAVIAFASAPATGTVTLEYKPLGALGFVALSKAVSQPILSGRVSFRIDGPLEAIRLTFDGMEQGNTPVLWLDTQEYPTGAFSGNAAIVTQPYTEANVKRGVQFYLRANWSLWGATDTPAHGPIGAGETRKVLFEVGDKPIVVKLRDFSYSAEEIVVRLFENPTGVSGGVPLVIHNYNGRNPVATTISATRDVATISDGTQFDGGDPETLFGANASGQRSQSAIPLGRERVLPAGGTYLVTITNTGTGTARAQYFLDWYEGGTDLPL